MPFSPKHINKMTLIKAIAALVVIVTVLVVGVISVVLAATNAANSGALAAYESWGEKLSASVRLSAEEKGITVSNSLTDAQLASLLSDENGFDGVAIATSSRHVLYENGDLLGDFIPSNLEMLHDTTTVGTSQIGDKDYAIVVSHIDGEYYAIGYVDFTSSVAAIAGLKRTVTAISLISALFVIAAFIAYVIATGVSERGHRYKYKLVTDVDGRIISSNKAFKEDFPQTIRLYENVTHFSESKLTAIKIPYYDDEVFVACSAKKTHNGKMNKIKLSADLLTMPYNAQATKPTDMMREVYTSFVLKGKPFLIGKINFTELPNINEMFGQEFTENVHSVLYERIAKRFTYIYELDLYNIGVIFPSGKDYDILLEDLKGIVDSYNEPLKIEENIVYMKVNCGFAVCDKSMPERSFEYAMTSVDAALRRAKQDPQKDYYVFHGTDIKAYHKFFFNYDIPQMLADNMFEMEFQPQYSIKQNKIVGFEALFRVKKEANVFVNIFDLISYAERSGYMVLLSEFIFDTAIKFAESVQDKGVTVSLNLSPVQLMQAGFCESFLEIYNRHNMKPGVVCVEITESFLVKNFDSCVKKLEILHENGIDVHLDDFGTRYSSLLYLKKLPIKTIKIDREFIIDVTDNGLDYSITKMIADLCKKHEFDCIAEGVETKEQFDTLKEIGVDLIQGWLIGKSVPSGEAARLIDEFRL